MSKAVGIIDEPVKPGAADNLDINIHSQSLIEFIEKTNTPITIGIQGEWGSGKTSLLNSIYHHFENKGGFKQIWINSWESSLLSTPEESLLKIINEIIEELLAADQSKSKAEKIKNSAATVFKGALRIGATAALGNKAGDVAEELLSTKENSIKALRNQLTDLVLEIESRNTNPYKNVIIYVDDLDRIEPKNAVAVLELLKNIFSVPNCIFILAIDYQVVVKGLEHKFGKQTAENEWEFRAFFDKIIQLPFMMPMGQYNIGKYVNELLKNIGFVTDEGLDDDAVREIITRTIGGNPRSLKRLVNSVALIEIFKQKKSDKQSERDDSDLSENQEKLVLFSLLCLQIAYPYIYSLLLEHNEFHKWNDELAFEKTQRKEEVEIDYPGFQREFENAKNSDDFDEEWERALFRICYVYPRLKPRASEISKFLSYLKDELFKDKQDNIGRTLSSILSQTSVTSVTSTDQQQPVGQFKDAAWKSADQKSISNKLWNMALDVLQDTTVIYKKGRRSGSSGVMRLTDKEIGGDVIFGLHQGPGLYIYISNLNEQVSISLMEKIMSNKEKIEEELGFSVRWEPSNKRAQYIRFDYSDMVKLSQFSKKDWPRPLKSWDNISPRNNLFPMEEDLEIMTKFFAEFAPIFEKVMRKYILKIIQEDN